MHDLTSVGTLHTTPASVFDGWLTGVLLAAVTGWSWLYWPLQAAWALGAWIIAWRVIARSAARLSATWQAGPAQSPVPDTQVARGGCVVALMVIPLHMHFFAWVVLVSPVSCISAVLFGVASLPLALEGRALEPVDPGRPGPGALTVLTIGLVILVAGWLPAALSGAVACAAAGLAGCLLRPRSWVTALTAAPVAWLLAVYPVAYGLTATALAVLGLELARHLADYPEPAGTWIGRISRAQRRAALLAGPLAVGFVMALAHIGVALRFAGWTDAPALRWGHYQVAEEGGDKVVWIDPHYNTTLVLSAAEYARICESPDWPGSWPSSSRTGERMLVTRLEDRRGQVVLRLESVWP